MLGTNVNCTVASIPVYTCKKFVLRLHFQLERINLNDPKNIMLAMDKHIAQFEREKSSQVMQSQTLAY